MERKFAISKGLADIAWPRSVHVIWFIAVLLAYTLAACVPSVAVGQVTVFVFPMEHPKPGTTPFEEATYRKDYGNIEILNSTRGEWEKLRIGCHRWLCKELNDLAAKHGQIVRLRFLSWEHALDNLAVTYKGQYDVCQVPSSFTAALIAKGILAPYDFTTADYPPLLLETCCLDGEKRSYAVPWHMDFRVIYYADRLTTNPDDLLEYKSFAACLLRRQAQMRSSPDGKWEAPLGLGITRNEWDILHNTFNWAFGGRIVERQGRQWVAVFAEPEPAAGVQRLLDLRNQGLIRFVEADKAKGEQEWMTLARGVIEGRHDVVLGGPYMRVAFTDRPDVKAARLPRMIPRADTTFLGGSHLGLTTARRDSRQEQLARAIIQRLTSKEASVDLYQNTDAMPARNDAFQQFLENNERWSGAFLAARNSGKAYPSIPQWAKNVEVELGPGLLHNTLDSIASGRDWQGEGLPNLTQAAEEVTEAIYEWWWVKWAIAGGVLAVAALLAVPTWLWRRSDARARRALRESYELLEQVERRSKELGVSQGHVVAELRQVHLVLEAMSVHLDMSEQTEGDRVETWESIAGRVESTKTTLSTLGQNLPELRPILTQLTDMIELVWKVVKKAARKRNAHQGEVESTLAKFPWPCDFPKENRKWELVVMTIDRATNTAESVAANVVDQQTFESLRFADKQKRQTYTYRKSWVALVRLARQALAVPREKSAKQNLQQDMSDIRERLRSYFGIIEGDPIVGAEEHGQPVVRYTPSFQLRSRPAYPEVGGKGLRWEDITIAWENSEDGRVIRLRSTRPDPSGEWLDTTYPVSTLALDSYVSTYIGSKKRICCGLEDMLDKLVCLITEGSCQEDSDEQIMWDLRATLQELIPDATGMPIDYDEGSKTWKRCIPPS